MSNLFIVFANVDYEGSTTLAVFKNKNTADSLAEVCNLYQAAMPACGDSINNGGFDDFLLEEKAWEDAHPARKYREGGLSYFDDYSVEEVLFVED